MSDLLLTGIGELVTNDPDRNGLLGVVADAAVAVKSGRVAWVGPEADLLREFRELPELDCAGRAVIPGWPRRRAQPAVAPSGATVSAS